MPADAAGACDFGFGMSDFSDMAEELLSQLRGGIKAAAGQHSQWERKFERKFGGHGGPAGHWGGGFSATRGGWWPGQPPSPPPGRGPKAARGDVRAAILALLQEGPRNGYQIMSEIEERSGGAWRPSPGAVYPALSALADQGLIMAEESGGKRTYSLTQAGRDYIAQHPEAARGAWESSQQQEAWQLPGLFATAARLGSGIVQLAHAGTPAQVSAAERLLERTRRELYRILSEDDEDESGPAGQGS